MDKTFFGRETIDPASKTPKVQEIFSTVSGKYDLMNDVMSGFQHRLWKRDFVANFSLKPNLHHLDMATGTGDIVKRLVKRLEKNQLNYSLIGADLNQDMLQIAKNKLFDEGIYKNIDWCAANAEALPFDSDQFDSYSIAFGIRNVTNLSQALTEARRCLKTGRPFYCLEFSKPATGVFSTLYDMYAFNVIPRLGNFIAGNKMAYQYLVESIETFLAPDEFKNTLEKVGFDSVAVKTYANGLVCAYTAWKKV